ncbi:hypothetical protein DSL72_008055 [Monilinia vaccinii-corymbosi]|uniref:Uncharacterized protein n=1 Tax=Monilinia vaccinii-corymbosi TaxID=61207 RepID=A0A8A3PIU8_9HELO|nr:hypothetical protein DSL72_008055 [Monilinia vaccinii-corymbosi]
MKMPTKKKKTMGASAPAQLPAGTASLSALTTGAHSQEIKHPIITPQEAEIAQGHGLLQPPMIKDEDCCEECTGSESDGEGFLDDDMDFLPTCWGRADKPHEDEERAAIARKAKLKKAKVQASTTMTTTSFGKGMATVEQAVSESIKMINSATTIEFLSRRAVPSSFELARAATESTSQALDAVTCNVSVTKAMAPKTQPSTKLIEKITRQERDQKSAKTQAGCLRAEIQVLKQKHRLEMQKQLDHLDETHRREMDAIKLELKESEGICQKASTDLRKVRDKNSIVRSERRELDLKLVEMSENVARHTENISVLERQKIETLASMESLSRSLHESTQKLTTSEFRLALEQRKSAMLQQQGTSLREENRRIRLQQSRSTATSVRLQQLEQNYDGLKDGYYALKDEHDELVEDAARYRRERTEYKDDAEYYREKRDTLRTELESNRDLGQKKYQELKKAHDIREPLVKIGVAIRLRFLDQVRETALGIPRDEADMALRANGNVAAHKDNAAADAALFKGNFVPEEYEEHAKEIFKELYRRSSS